MNSVLIHMAEISHKHGTDIFPALSEEGVNQQVVEYCKENWDEDEHGSMGGLEGQELVDAYFHENWDEFVSYGVSYLSLEGVPKDRLLELAGFIREAAETQP